MGNISWTKSWSSSDDGSILDGDDLKNIQDDIVAVINDGGLTNTNINAAAGIVESKLTFSTTTGHRHNGTDSRLAIPPKHYIRGGKITRSDNANLTVGPIAIDIEGVMFTSVAASAAIDVSVAANYLKPKGGSAGDEPADGPIYIYAYDNGGTLAFKLGDENAAPTLSYSDDTTVEYPLRYIEDDDDVTYYRLISIIHNRTNLVADSMTYIDKQFVCGSFVGDAATETIVTGWTPKYIRVVQIPDATPVAGEDIKENFASKYCFATAAPYPADLNFSNQAAITDLIDEDVAGSITAVTAQSAGTAGSFGIYQPVTGAVCQWVAWTDEV